MKRFPYSNFNEESEEKIKETAKNIASQFGHFVKALHGESGKIISHYDPTLGNFVVSEKGDLTLIDIGFVEDNLCETAMFLKLALDVCWYSRCQLSEHFKGEFKECRRWLVYASKFYETYTKITKDLNRIS